MTATDELRRMLDEQNPLKMQWCVPTGGNPDYDTNVINDDYGVFHFSEDPQCGLDLKGVTLFGFLTPEQAIEATLGRGTCRVEKSSDGYGWHCECGNFFPPTVPPRKFCPNCGAKVVGE